MDFLTESYSSLKIKLHFLNHSEKIYEKQNNEEDQTFSSFRIVANEISMQVTPSKKYLITVHVNMSQSIHMLSIQIDTLKVP